jgi:UDP-3-O-[3-hydroxymyristoyl] glucosamine N-acyltransferase
VTIAGQVTIEPGVEIGQRAIIAARSLVTQNVPPGRVYSGIPARPHIHEKRILACIGKLPSLYRRIQDLEERINPENNR